MMPKRLTLGCCCSGMSHKHIYNSKIWKALRDDQLMREPLCCFCLKLGIITAANTVNHIKPHRGDEALAFDPENLESCCKPCHDIHGDAQDRGKTMAGCDGDGYPIDPDHPWS